MNKILVLFTGGTIGSRISGNIIDIHDTSKHLLIEKYRELYNRDDVEFEIHQPLNILSENIITENWIKLYEYIINKDLKEYKGIIVAHGSDTLAFTSTVLSLMLNWIDIPLVITASNRPLESPNSNGVFNFYYSVEYIVNNDISGVFAIYSNEEGVGDVYIGTRITQANYFTDKFNDNIPSINFGKMIDGKFVRNIDKRNLDFETLRNRKKEKYIKNFQFSNEILYIRPFPGLDYRYYEFKTKKPKAILHDLYHSGTACTIDYNSSSYSINKFIEKALKKGIDVYIPQVKKYEGSMYDTAKQIVNSGAIMLPNISLEVALIKLMIVYAHEDWDRGKKIVYLLNSNIFFEHIYKYFK